MTIYKKPGEWTEADLIAGSQTTPVPAHLRGNAKLLVDFMNKIPFRVGINSGYRSSGTTNVRVGGSSTSQHPNALAVDLQPVGMTNMMLGAWFWVMRPFFPELDQVIVYTRKSHVHVGICPPGATGCPSPGHPRKEFLINDAGDYDNWVVPQQLLLADIMGINPLNPRRWVVAAAISTGLSLVVLAAVWRFRKPLQKRLGL